MHNPYHPLPLKCYSYSLPKPKLEIDLYEAWFNITLLQICFFFISCIISKSFLQVSSISFICPALIQIGCPTIVTIINQKRRINNEKVKENKEELEKLGVVF